MLLYAPLTIETFNTLAHLLEMFQPFIYYGEWQVTFINLSDQLNMTLMKLKLNYRDLDLTDWFNVNRRKVNIIVKILITALYEILFLGIMNEGMPSLMKCKSSIPDCFENFASCRAVMDYTEITMDISAKMNKQAACYSNYKSRHTVKVCSSEWSLDLLQ